MFYDKMLNNIEAMAGFEPAPCELKQLNDLTLLPATFRHMLPLFEL